MDTYESYVWEPSLVKINALTAATEAACLVLSVDETVTNPKSEAANMAPGVWAARPACHARCVCSCSGTTLRIVALGQHCDVTKPSS